MKYVSLAIVGLFMAWSWCLVHDQTHLEQSIHVDIQRDLKRYISDYVKDNLPNSNKLEFKKMWTETVNPRKVKASFLYEFTDNNETSGPTKVALEGYAILNQKVEGDNEFDYWSFDELYILNNKIEFDEVEIKINEDANE